MAFVYSAMYLQDQSTESFGLNRNPLLIVPTISRCADNAFWVGNPMSLKVPFDIYSKVQVLVEFPRLRMEITVVTRERDCVLAPTARAKSANSALIFQDRLYAIHHDP